MKNQDIVTCYEGLNSLREGDSTHFPARVSYAIVRDIKTLKPIIEDIQMAYNEIVTKYAAPIEDDPTRFKVPEENISILNEEMGKLYKMETDVNLVKIKFSDIESLSLSLKETEALMAITEEEN